MRTLIIKEEDLIGTVFEQHFDDLLRISQKRNQSLEYILTVICARYYVSEKDVLSSSRKRNIVIARTAFMFIAREIDLVCGIRYKHSLEFVGSIVNRDYSTVIHAIERIKNDCNSSKFKEDTKDLIYTLFGSIGVERFETFLNKSKPISICNEERD